MKDKTGCSTPFHARERSGSDADGEDTAAQPHAPVSDPLAADFAHLTLPGGPAERVQRRIAQALGMSSTAFLEQGVETVQRAEPDAAASESQTLALVRAFSRISDPQTRRMCLEMIEAAADREAERDA
ncbi:hypothetical protein [Methylobacterium sp. ID0610]|uniref:hypothetical protein n=1 Tax=Methylobacterium carpenticola TaxID=3344827 RepID=UPI00369C8827